MPPDTILRRLPLVASLPLEERVMALCDTYLGAGYPLAALTLAGAELLFVFQKSDAKNKPPVEGGK